MKQFFQNIGKTEIRNILGVIVVIGCFVLLYILQVKPIPAANKDVLNIAIGFVFGGALAGVIGYYFGSSKPQPESKDQK
jgi:Na+-driven multidrug efflux pump